MQSKHLQLSVLLLSLFAALLTLQTTSQAQEMEAVSANAEHKPAQTVFIDDSSCPGESDLSKAEDLFRQRRFAQAKGLFESAIKESESSSGTKLSALAIGTAKHQLGHILDYLWEDDHGEKYFSEAMKEYEKVDWPPIPLLGIGRQGSEILERLSRGDRTALQAYNNRLNWSVILEANYDWAQAAYRNKHYEEACEAFKKFYQRQNSAHPVAMCVMSNRMNGTYLGQPLSDHYLDSAIQVFAITNDPKPIAEALSTIAGSKLWSRNLNKLELLTVKAEEFMQQGKSKQAKMLLETAESRLREYFSAERNKFPQPYDKAFPAFLTQMKSADSVKHLYKIPDQPGKKEADIAEAKYWKRDYNNAAHAYLELLNSQPAFEVDLIEKDGIIGAPIARHLTESCLHIFENDPAKGTDVLTQASTFLDRYAGYGFDRFFFDPLEAKAENYFYSGQIDRAKLLFMLERKFAGEPKLQGLVRTPIERADAYLSRIARRENSK